MQLTNEDIGELIVTSNVLVVAADKLNALGAQSEAVAVEVQRSKLFDMLLKATQLPVIAATESVAS